MRCLQRAFFLLPVLASFAQPTGALDSSFVPPELDSRSAIYAMATVPDGRSLIAGNFRLTNEVGARLVARLNTDGSIDPTFFKTSRIGGYPTGIVRQKNGGIVVIGTFVSINDFVQPNIARLNPDGTIDKQFVPRIELVSTNSSSLLPTQLITHLLVQPDDKLLVAGVFSSVAGLSYPGLVRLNSDGSLDKSFKPALILALPAFPGASRVGPIFLQDDGKVLVRADLKAPRQSLVRLNPDGSLDGSFNSAVQPGVLDPIVQQSDGKLVVATWPEGILRLNADGSLDGNLGPLAKPDDLISAMVLQSDGKLIIGGAFKSINGVPRTGLARLNSDGTLDELSLRIAFDPGMTGTVVRTMALNGTERLLFAGAFNRVEGAPRPGLAQAILRDAPNAPSIFQQPTNTMVFAGDAVTFRVTAISHVTPNYQWRFKGRQIFGATNSTLVLRNVQFNQAGDYDVMIADPAGEIKSQSAALTVVPGGALSDWKLRRQVSASLPPNARRFLGYAFGANLHVIVGDDGLIMTSRDRRTWTRQNSGTAVRLTSALYVNGTFYVAGSFGTILRSTDGMIWNSVERLVQKPIGSVIGNPFTHFVEVVYGDGMFTAVTASGSLYTSSDGTDWQWTPGFTGPGDVHLAYGNGTLAVVGYVLYPSPFLGAFTLPLKDLKSVVFGNGKFVAAGIAGAIATSLDGTNWIRQVSGTTNDFTAAGYGNGLFVASGAAASQDAHQPSLLLTSPDGVTWTQRASPSLFPATVIGYADGAFIAFANTGEGPWTTSEIWRSTNGINWEIEISPGILRSVAFGNGTFVTVGDSGRILTSADGLNWAQQASPTQASLYEVAQGNGVFVAVGWGGTILSSTNGTAWLERTSGTDLPLRGVTFGQGMFVAIGSRGIFSANAFPLMNPSVILTSPDGVVWRVTHATNNDGGASDVAYGNSRFVGVGALTTSYTTQPRGTLFSLISPDGLGWSEVPSRGLPSETGVAGFALHKLTFGNGLFVASSSFSTFGYPEAVAVSTNGTDWLQAGLDRPAHEFLPGSPGSCCNVPAINPLFPGGVTGVAFGRGTFLALGAGAMFSSTNATTWNRRSIDISATLFDAAFGNGTFVAVGENETVLQSAIFQDEPRVLLQNPTMMNGKFQVSVVTGPGKTYILEAADKLDAASWIPTATITGNGAALILSDPNPNAARKFYRVRSP